MQATTLSGQTQMLDAQAFWMRFRKATLTVSSSQISASGMLQVNGQLLSSCQGGYGEGEFVAYVIDHPNNRARLNFRK
jgi:hypothetical protein